MVVRNKNLINGRIMTCPRCKNGHDVLQYTPLEMKEEYETETTPIYKCPSCRWLFAPAGEMPQEVYSKLYAAVSELINLLTEKKA